jgi:hypothetical protein
VCHATWALPPRHRRRPTPGPLQSATALPVPPAHGGHRPSALTEGGYRSLPRPGPAAGPPLAKRTSLSRTQAARDGQGRQVSGSRDRAGPSSACAMIPAQLREPHAGTHEQGPPHHVASMSQSESGDHQVPRRCACAATACPVLAPCSRDAPVRVHTKRSSPSRIADVPIQSASCRFSRRHGRQRAAVQCVCARL